MPVLESLLNEVATFRLQLYEKRGSGTDVFLWVLQKKKLLDALSSGTALDFPKIVPIAICSNSPVLNGRLTFGEDNSCHPVSSWNLTFFEIILAWMSDIY